VRGLRLQTSHGTRFDAVVHRARLATPYPAAMPARPKGSGGAGSSAVLPRLGRGKPSPSPRRLPADPAALRTQPPWSAVRASDVAHRDQVPLHRARSATPRSFAIWKIPLGFGAPSKRNHLVTDHPNQGLTQYLRFS